MFITSQLEDTFSAHLAYHIKKEIIFRRKNRQGYAQGQGQAQGQTWGWAWAWAWAWAWFASHKERKKANIDTIIRITQSTSVQSQIFVIGKGTIGQCPSNLS